MSSTGPTLVSGTINLGGAALGYRFKSGDHKLLPVLLLHPWWGCWQFWERTMDALPNSCYAVDWYSIGRGAWQPFAGPIGLSAAVLALMDAKQIDRCVVIGNSMGGITAQVLASMVPHRVSKLVLIGTGASTVGVQSDFRSQLEEWMQDPDDVLKCTAMVRTLFASKPPPRQMDLFLSEVLAANKDFMTGVLRSAMGLDLGPRLRYVKADTMVIWGTLDRIRTKEQAKEMHAGISGSIVVELAGAGHSPMVDRFDEFRAYLESFL